MEELVCIIKKAVKDWKLNYRYEFKGPMSEEDFVAHIAFLLISNHIAYNVQRTSWRKLVDDSWGNDSYSNETLYGREEDVTRLISARLATNFERGICYGKYT